MILAMIALIALLTLVIVLAAGGVGTLIGLAITFGDVIVFCIAVYYLLKWLFGPKKK